MPIKVSAKVEGAKRFREALKKLTDDEKKAIRATVKASGARVRDGAAARSRKKSGKTAKSFKTRSILQGMGVRIGSDYPNARFQEMGTKRQAAYPVLFPALEAESNRFQSDMAAALSNAGNANASESAA